MHMIFIQEQVLLVERYFRIEYYQKNIQSFLKAFEL